MQEVFTSVVSQDNMYAWQEAHKTGIGASQIAAVLGEHRFGSRLRIWAEKVGRLEPRDFSDNEAVQMGIELEPFVAKKYEKRTGRAISGAGYLLRSTEHPWALCTPDYWLCGEDGDWNIPLQIKTTSAWRLNDWEEGPPKEVWWQVQHEMLVTGAPWASIGVLVGGQRFMWTDVSRDEQAMERIVREGYAFWQDVQQQTYPLLDGNSADALTELFPTSAEGEQVALPQEAVEWDIQLQNLKAQRRLLDDDIQAYEDRFKLAIGEAESGILHDGSGAYTHKSQQRWSYKLPEGSSKPSSGDLVTTIAHISEFRVLRRSGGR